MFCTPARPTPHQLPAFGPLPHPHPDLDAVIGQETQHPVRRAQPVKQVEDQADHRLDLLIGIHGHLSRRTPHETGRQPPGPHPLLDQMQLSLWGATPG